MVFVNLLVGFILALAIALAAYRARTLDRSGAVAAAVLGTLIFGLGGLAWAFLLIAFFVSSSLLSRLFGKRKRSLDEKFSKGSRRDAWQVAANGGVAGLFALMHAFFPAETWPWIGCAAALAAANADTWATELGVLSRNTPRMIHTGKPVERGTSGGVTLEGTLAALAGSALIALIAVVFWRGYTGLVLVGVPFRIADLMGITPVDFSFEQRLLWFGWITLAGLLGSLIDSLLGATLQAIYRCPRCGKETEKYPLHSCGAQTTLVRGLPWLDNDWVNTFCTVSAALAAVVMWYLL